ncbi:hypothetical protein OG756_24655 [Streptomyces sp. NBC_01310]|uniref:hypothetical protein n=1 Tax=Streptomyces sp. NBC_01310 TaxID=2903820 RepID=UPI0035B66179|nr:hypothetical protein OG756_24655 [Streptomyces sp. NBC_01310]
MATSRAGGRLLGYLESKKNLAGSACGVAGLGLTLAGVAGAYWPLVVAGLYGAGALIAPPERVAPPHHPDPAEQLGVVREDFGRLRVYLAEVELPAAAAGKLAELLEFYEALLDPGWVAEVLAADPESVHTVSRAVRQDVPECVDTYNRTRWWARLSPGGESPEQQLERQLAALFEEAERVTATLREAEALRQQTHTTYLEDRGRS